jgi:hypothetical protein
MLGRDRPLAAALALVLGALALSGCARGGSLPPLALRPQPIPYADTLPIHEPEDREPAEIWPLIRESTVGELGQPFDPDDWIYRNEALNVTHFDEVVNSAWFEHRIARRDLSDEEMRLGPTSLEGQPRPPYTVTRLKGAGISPGLWVEDGKGDVYLFKFDPPENLYLASAANTISNRLFWASGFHAPEDYLATFDAMSLVIQEAEGSPTEEEVQEVLEQTAPLADGRYRAIASKLLPGPPKGPFRFRGTRKDDPNDYYLHQNRRELRGLYVLSAWTNHVDMRFANTLDVWLDPPGYLRHYLQDFGATLGSGTIRPHNPREGMEYNFDVWAFLARLPTFGFYQVGWEEKEFEVIDPSIGWIPVDSYRPGAWKPNWPNAAFRSATVADGYWAAKIVARFSDRLIRAAVEAGELPDRRVADTLASILIARRDKTVDYWFGRVSPIEGVRVDCTDASGPGFGVSFDDMGIAVGVRHRSNTRYEWELKDEGRGRHWKGSSVPPGAGPSRLHVAPPDATDACRPASGTETPTSGYTDVSAERLAVLRLRAEKLGPTATPRPRPANVYLVWISDEEGYAVIGLEH